MIFRRQRCFRHTVRAGDTLYILAGRFCTTVERLMADNPGIDPYNLRIGSTLRVCCSPERPPQDMSPNCCIYYVREGDSLYILANRFNTTVERLMADNPGVDPYNLRIGSILFICFEPVRPLDTEFSKSESSESVGWCKSNKNYPFIKKRFKSSSNLKRFFTLFFSKTAKIISSWRPYLAVFLL